MPTPPTSHPIRIKIYDINGALLEGATVSLTLGTNDPITETSNSKGEVVLNVANAGSWTVGQSITLTATKTGVGTVTSTLVLTNSPQETSLTLTQTSDFYYEENDCNVHRLDFVMLVDFQGNKITNVNPLPIKLVDGSGTRIKASQQEENRLGSDVIADVLTLQNTSETGGPVSILIESQPISVSDYSINHLSSNSTITFTSGLTSPTDAIRVFYYV